MARLNRLHGAVAAKWNDSSEAQREQYAAVSAVLPEFFYLLESRHPLKGIFFSMFNAV